jgi:hypothetical protein
MESKQARRDKVFDIFLGRRGVKESYFCALLLFCHLGIASLFECVGLGAAGCDGCAIIIGGCLGMGRDALGRVECMF